MSANRKGTFCGSAEIIKKNGGVEEGKKKMLLVSILSFSQMLGATSSMRTILSLVSFPIYYSQLGEEHWWGDQQQSLSIYPAATPAHSRARETLITSARDSREGAKLAKSWRRSGARILRGGLDSRRGWIKEGKKKRKSCGFDVLFTSR